MNHAALASLFLVAACTGGDDAPADDAPPDDGELLVTPVGRPTGAPTAFEVGPDGGHGETPDGRLAIDVPPGAVAAPTTFTIQPGTNEMPGGFGAAYLLGPEGQTFAVPVTLTFAYDTAELGDNDPAVVMVVTQTEHGTWNRVGSFTTDPGARTVSVHAKHFSWWAAGSGFNVTPMYSTVATGATKELKVRMCGDPPGCEYETDDGVIDPDCELECTTGFLLDATWSINGTVGGTIDEGTIRSVPGSSSAIYTAPDRAPDPDNVQVSVRCGADCSPHGTVIAFGRIWIEDKPLYVGHVNSSSLLVEPYATWTSSSAATVTFGFDEDDQRYHPIEGTLHATLGLAGSPCSMSYVYDGALGRDDGMLAIVGSAYVHAGVVPDAPMPGTLTCENGQTAPIETDGPLAWWPTESSSGTDPVGLGGVLEGSETYVRGDGTTVSVDWHLEPIDPDQME